MNAIILAAGLGGRLGAITRATPKPLTKVGGVPIIERQIKCLREIGVEDIYIVTGYLHHCFFYLKNKYQVRLLFNPEYNNYNNIYSLYISCEYFGESYILEGDVFLNRNFLKEKISSSTYFSGLKQNIENEWILEFNSTKKLERILVLPQKILPDNYADGAFITSGISYWTKNAADIIKSSLNDKIALLKQDDDAYNIKNYFWDQLVLENMNKLEIRVEIVRSDDWFEIDCLADLNIARSTVQGYPVHG